MKKFFVAKDKIQIITILSVLAFPAIMVGLVGPFEIYNANYIDFPFSFLSVVFTMLIETILVYLVLLGILLILPNRVTDFVCKCIFGISILMYIQYLFLNRQLARNDGLRMDWSEMSSITIHNSVIISLLLILVVVFTICMRKVWNKIVSAVSLMITALMLLSVMWLLISTPFGSNSNYRIIDNEKYTVSSDENLIIIVLDTYGNELFDKAYAENENIVEGLNDFTFYNNCDCRYYRTYPSMSAILTCEDYDFNSLDHYEYLNKAWTSDKTNEFYNEIYNAGWDFYLYADNDGNYYGNLEYLEGKINNIEKIKADISYKHIIYHFTRGSIYKFVPYIMKPYFEEWDYRDIYHYEYSFEDDEYAYLQQMPENGLVEKQDNKRITILHMFGAHNATNVGATVKKLHDFVGSYIEELKKLDLYDSSTIVVMADHGSWNSFVEMDPQPILFVKQKNEHHDEMQFCSAPISWTDIKATILGYIGVDGTRFGNSIYDWKEGDYRERTLYQMNADNEYYGYTYYTDKKELIERISSGPSVIERYAQQSVKEEDNHD